MGPPAPAVDFDLAYYKPGPGVVVHGRCSTVLLAVVSEHPLVESCWTAILAADPCDDLLELIVRTGLDEVAGFCVVDRRAPGRLITFGTVSAVTGAAGGSTSPARAGRWTEVSLAGVLDVDASLVEATGPWLPILAGVVGASRISTAAGSLVARSSDAEPAAREPASFEPAPAVPPTRSIRLPDPPPEVPIAPLRSSTDRRLIESAPPELIVRPSRPEPNPSQLITDVPSFDGFAGTDASAEER